MWKITIAIFISLGLAQALHLRKNPFVWGEARVSHLVQDIEESVDKAGEDAEMVFQTLFTYDGQLDVSLKKEIGALNQTLTSLLKMQATYNIGLRNSSATLSELGAQAQTSANMASKYAAGSTRTRSKFDGLQDNVQNLIALLKHAQITSQGTLVTAEAPDARGEPSRVFTAIRRLLAATPSLKETHPEVFDAFLKRSSGGASAFPVVRMTQGLLKNTIGALSEVKDHFESMESQALVQLSSMHSHSEEDAVSSAYRAEAQQGIEAENEEKVAELSFSIKFTSAVLKIDQKFAQTVGTHLASNSELIHTIRDLRQAQLKILRDLRGIFGAEGAIATAGVSNTPGAGLSFLELDAASFSSFQGGLESEVESALHNHVDTHAILMRVKDMLDNAEPINTESVQSTVMEMQGVLHSVEADKSKYEEAKRGCESQTFHVKEQEEGLIANMALMTAAHDHAAKAIKAAKKNVDGIEKKAHALEKSSKDFSHISSQALKSLEGQSKDRATILMAVQKAIEVVASERVSTAHLMQTLSQDMSTQETKEKIYRKQQHLFEAAFSSYVKEYEQLLADRRRHYESSVGVLELHVSELGSDLLAQKQILGTGRQLREQSAGLCESVLHFYDKHAKMRADLSKSLRSIVPSMTAVLTDTAIASTR